MLPRDCADEALGADCADDDREVLVAAVVLATLPGLGAYFEVGKKQDLAFVMLYRCFSTPSPSVMPV